VIPEIVLSVGDYCGEVHIGNYFVDIDVVSHKHPYSTCRYLIGASLIFFDSRDLINICLLLMVIVIRFMGNHDNMAKYAIISQEYIPLYILYL